MKLLQGDCIDILKTLENNSIDAIVTDPPYGLSFMGKKWDYDVPSLEIWQECLRVLKPGGYLLSFAGTRTQHRMAVRIEDAGFEIRDMIAWVYGSGFPKSLNIGKAVDKTRKVSVCCNSDVALAARRIGLLEYICKKCGKHCEIKQCDREDIGAGNDKGRTKTFGGGEPKPTRVTKGTSEWEGWGTALKPALEPITVARKPIEGTVAENCLKWGTGGINIDECRVQFVSEEDRKESTTKNQHEDFGTKPMTNNNVYGDYSMMQPKNFNPPGRFPANLIHDGSDEVVELFPNSKSSPCKNHIGSGRGKIGLNPFSESRGGKVVSRYVGEGSAARFFYCAKASKSERNMGCEGLEEKQTLFAEGSNLHNNGDGSPRNKEATMKNNHPTVKPIALMEYLIKLVSREGHTVLDPFMGSGSTGIACKKLNRHFIGIEREPDYITIAENRIEAVPKTLF